MKYTYEQQERAIHDSARELGLDAHINKPTCKKDLYSYADKISSMWFRPHMPVKRSYMMCDSLDMDFFFTEDGTAIYTYAGYADDRDGNNKIVEAFTKANEMRVLMQKKIEEGV